MLIHPFLRAAQIVSRNPNFSKESLQTFSKFLKKNFPENIIGEVAYLLIGLVLIVLVLVRIFDQLTTVHYLAIVLYVVSVAMLDIAVAEIDKIS